MAVELQCDSVGQVRYRAGAEVKTRRLGDADLDRFGGWIAEYRACLGKHGDSIPALLRIGRAMTAWLDGLGLAVDPPGSAGAVALTVAVPNVSGLDEVFEKAFLDLPWELLAGPSGFLAEDAIRPFQVLRRLGAAQTPRPALWSDLHVLFMAAAPDDGSELSFEAEEAAILDATRASRAVHLAVEESGALAPLALRLREREAPQVLHVSCHGGRDTQGGYLVLETDWGDADRVHAGALVAALGENAVPPLLFLSACHTAEGDRLADSLAVEMLQAGVPTVLGWDGAVYDSDAAAFAAKFYERLAATDSPAAAAGSARRHLLQQAQNDRQSGGGQHWHLARLYCGPQGGAALCAPGQPPRHLRARGEDTAYLDRKANTVPVAGPDTFVGRRRQVQAALRVFGEGHKAGVVITGMGRQGKSSLAARITSRLSGYEVVGFVDDYHTTTLLRVLLNRLPPTERLRLRPHIEPLLVDPSLNEGALRDGLELLLQAATTVPFCIVIDDAEQMLEQPAAGEALTRVKPGDAPVLRAVIATFGALHGHSRARLLLTSRYHFTLPGPDGDAAAALAVLPLPALAVREREKLFYAHARQAGLELSGVDGALAQALLDAAQGNAGLQTLLCRPLCSGEAPLARTALAAVQQFQHDGKSLPAGGDLGEFFKALKLDIYVAALTPDERTHMRAASLFLHPVPPEILHLAGTALGVQQPGATLARLRGLGCLESHRIKPAPGAEPIPHLISNALARPLFDALSDAESRTVATATVEPVAAAWVEADGLPWDARALHLFDLTDFVPAARDLRYQAARAAVGWLRHHFYDQQQAIFALAQRALAGFVAAQHPAPPLELFFAAADAARQLGKILQAQSWIAQAETVPRDGQERAFAMLQGIKADIHETHGEYAEALRIRRDEQLPVFERLGDVRERAVTWGKIGDIHEAQGEYAEALRIRRDEQLPVFERLGDVRSQAVTWGKIGDIHQAQRDYAEALRIHCEKELPVFERLGDERSWAMTWGRIGDIHQAQRDYGEALRIRRDKQLPVYERLGDVWSRATAQLSMAQIAIAQGITTQEQFEDVQKRLADNYAIVRNLEWAEGIGAVGMTLARFLGSVGAFDAALPIADAAVAAFTKLGNPQKLSEAQTLRAALEAAREGEGGGSRD
jgi:tetratricopeptide (TPR) repeat protein